MSESQQLVPVQKQSAVQERFLTITKPAEAGKMQESMLQWCQGKLKACEDEHDEGSKALEQARKHRLVYGFGGGISVERKIWRIHQNSLMPTIH